MSVVFFGGPKNEARGSQDGTRVEEPQNIKRLKKAKTGVDDAATIEAMHDFSRRSDVEALCAVIKASKSETVVTTGSDLLASFIDSPTMLDKETIIETILHTVSQAMLVYPDNTRLAENGCKVLQNMAIIYSKIADHVAKKAMIKIMIEGGAVSASVKAMNKFAESNITVAECGCIALHLFFEDADASTKKTMDEAGAVSAIVKAMNMFAESNPEVARNGCDALLDLSFVKDAHTMIEGGVITAIVMAMNKFAESDLQVANSGCWVLAELSSDKDASTKKTMIDSGAVSAIVKAMNISTESSFDVAEHGCEALMNVSSKAVSSIKKTMIDSGVVSAIMKAMNMFAESSPEVAGYGCTALMIFSSGDAPTKKTMIEGGAISAVVKAMHKYAETNHDVALHGCGVLLNLSSNQDAPAKRTMIDSGAVSAIMKGMTGWFANLIPQIAEYGFRALINFISTADEPRKKTMVEGGVVNVIVKAMNEYTGDKPDVALYGCQALLNLSSNQDAPTKKTMIDSGAVSAIMKAMDSGFEKYTPNVAVYGFGALINFISTADEPTKKTMVEGGAVSAIMKAMNEHLENEQVVRLGFTVLQHANGDPSEIVKMITRVGRSISLEQIAQAWNILNDAIDTTTSSSLKKLCREAIKTLEPTNRPEAMRLLKKLDEVEMIITDIKGLPEESHPCANNMRDDTQHCFTDAISLDCLPDRVAKVAEDNGQCFDPTELANSFLTKRIDPTTRRRVRNTSVRAVMEAAIPASMLKAAKTSAIDEKLKIAQLVKKFTAQYIKLLQS